MGEKIHFQNTLTGKKEAFVPLNPPEVRMYTCGPTVYDFAHIGNFRTFVFQDILRRFLRMRGYRVNQVMNLTDVDDRIIQNAAEAGISLREYTEKYSQAFLEDMRALGLEEPEKIVRATEHIDEMVRLIQRLGKKSFTYTSDGSIYFRIAKFPEYGKLSKIDLAGIQPGARVETDRYDVEDLFDGDGSALIIHASPDNYANIPVRYLAPPATITAVDSATLGTGDAGGRIACGVIEG